MDATAGEAQRRLEGAIEDLRVKYAKIKEDEEAAAEEAKKRAAMPAAAAAGSTAAELTEGTEDAREVEDEADVDGDDDPELRAIRERRLAAMKKKAADAQAAKAAGHGKYTEITEEDFLKEVTGSKHVVCHFYHTDFEKCKVMDKHLARLAPRFLGVKFIKLNAEKAPFFVGKLKVRTLPTLVRFKEGVADHSKRITGFEGLGGAEDFHTGSLALALGIVDHFDEYYEISGEVNPRDLLEGVDED